MPKIYVVLEQDLGLESPDFVKILEPWFEQFSEENGVNLMNYFGQSPEDFLDLDELEGLETEVQWFSAEEGLVAVTQLLEALRDQTSDDGLNARDELIDFRSLLEVASGKNLKFHLALDI